MGYMTVISILNDAWPIIKENPEQFIKNIEEGMENYNGRAVNSYPVANHANPMEVHRSFHANQNKVLVVGGNHMEDVVDFNERRLQEDFYLAYKMRTANTAKAMAESATAEIVNEFAKMAARDMVAIGKNIDQIADHVKTYDTYKAMAENDQKESILKIGVILATM